MKSVFVAVMIGVAQAPRLLSQTADPTLPFPAPKRYEHAAKIESADAFGLTIWYVDTIAIRPTLRFSAAYAYPEGKPITPRVVELSFATARQGGYDFERRRDLTLVLDDSTRLNLGSTEFDAASSAVRILVPIRKFLQIVNAHRVSGQVGDAAFQLDIGTLAALRDLASRMPHRE